MTEPQPEPPPVQRYFTVSVMVALTALLDENLDIDMSLLETACAEQITLPLTVSIGTEPLTSIDVIGVVQQSSTEVPEESLPPVLFGYGRQAPVEEQAA